MISRTARSFHQRYLAPLESLSHAVGLRFTGVTWYFVLVATLFALTQILFEPTAALGLSPLAKLGFFTGQAYLSLALLIAVTRLLGSVRLLQSLPSFAVIALSGAIGAMMFSPIALGLEVLFQPVDLDEPGAGPAVFSIPAIISEAASITPPITVIWMLINVPLLWRNTNQTEGTTPPQPEDLDQALLWQRLPWELGQDVITIEAQQHYLNVVTTEGSALIFLRLKEAVSALETVPGIQCHRSHWVALGHVKDLRGSRSNATCIMTNGLSVPVSRRRYGDVREALEAFSALRDSPRQPKDLDKGMTKSDGSAKG